MSQVNEGQSPAPARARYRVRVSGAVVSSIGNHTLNLVDDGPDVMLAYARVMIRLGGILYDVASQDLPARAQLCSTRLEVEKWA